MQLESQIIERLRNMNEKKLSKEELIGLHVKVKECKDPNWKGVNGIIIDETKKTFQIMINKEEKKIAKDIAIFEFDVDGKKITLDGSKIIYRPEDRIKKIR